jgi:hypothetical protein
MFFGLNIRRLPNNVATAKVDKQNIKVLVLFEIEYPSTSSVSVYELDS